MDLIIIFLFFGVFSSILRLDCTRFSLILVLFLGLVYVNFIILESGLLIKS